MSNLKNSIFAGFIASAVMTIFVLINNYFGVVSEVNFVDLINKINASYFHMPDTSWSEWLIHFIVGSVIYGGIFGLLTPKMTGSNVLNGIIIGIAAWLVMMLVVLPLTGMGVLEPWLSGGTRVASLVFHGIYGVFLGISYNFLTSR